MCNRGSTGASFSRFLIHKKTVLNKYLAEFVVYHSVLGLIHFIWITTTKKNKNKVIRKIKVNSPHRKLFLCALL